MCRIMYLGEKSRDKQLGSREVVELLLRLVGGLSSLFVS